MDIITGVLLKFLLFLDPTIQVVPVSLVCAPIESPQEVARAEKRAARAMDDMGKPQAGQIVDPFGVLSDGQREAIEHGSRTTGAR